MSWSSGEGRDIRAVRTVCLNSLEQLFAIVESNRWYRPSDTFSSHFESITEWLMDVCEEDSRNAADTSREAAGDDDSLAMQVLGKVFSLDVGPLERNEARIIDMILSVRTGVAFRFRAALVLISSLVCQASHHSKSAASLFVAALRAHSNVRGFPQFARKLMDALLSQSLENLRGAKVLGDSMCRLEFSQCASRLTLADQSALIADLGNLYFDRISNGTSGVSAKKLQGSRAENLAADFLSRAILAVRGMPITRELETILRRACEIGSGPKRKAVVSCSRLVLASMWSLGKSGLSSAAEQTLDTLGTFVRDSLATSNGFSAADYFKVRLWYSCGSTDSGSRITSRLRCESVE